MRRFFTLALIAIGYVLGSAPTAEAAFRMRIEDTVTNQGVVLTDNDHDGLITYSGVIGGLVVTTTVGASKPLIGGELNYAELDLVNFTIKNTRDGASTLRIILFDDDFTTGPDGVLSLTGRIGGTLTSTSGSITANTWANASNLTPDIGADGTYAPGAMPSLNGQPPAGSTSAWSDLPFVAIGTGDFSGNSGAAFVKSGSYSLISVVTVQLNAKTENVSFDFNTQVTPAPAGLVLAATGLPLLLAGARLRRRVQSAV